MSILVWPKRITFSPSGMHNTYFVRVPAHYHDNGAIFVYTLPLSSHDLCPHMTSVLLAHTAVVVHAVKRAVIWRLEPRDITLTPFTWPVVQRVRQYG